MKKLVLATALWFAAAGAVGTAIAADKAMEKEKKEATKAEAKAETKAAAKEATKDAPKPAAVKPGSLMVNINTATVDELKALKGIGETRAKDVIEYRKKNGDFKTIEDLEKVKGIGPGTMKQIRANITVSGETMIPKKAEAPAKAKDAKAPAKAMEKMEDKGKK